MGLSFDQRAALIARLAAASAASPARGRFRVVVWIILGYLLLGSIAFFALLLAVGVAWLIVAMRLWVLAKFAWIPGVFAWMLLRAIYVRVEPPGGRALLRHEAPLLFGLIDEIRRPLGVPKLDRVFLDGNMNAAVAETPVLGGLAGWRHHLLLGLPLMLTQSPEELRATLAHELGHLSGRHGRLGAWTYRLRETWMRVYGGLPARRDFISRAVRRLVENYVDRFLIVTLVQARAQELAADRAAADLTSPATFARSLAWVSVGSDLLDARLWQPIIERAAIEPEPSVTPMDTLLRDRQSILAPPHDEILAKHLARETDTDATHPALRERLAHLGVPEPNLALAPQSAAHALLPEETLAAVVRDLDASWSETVLPLWTERHGEAQRAREQLAAIPDENAATLTNEQLLDRADALLDLGREEEAEAMYAAAAQRDPSDPRAAFCHGRALLRRGDLDGLTHLAKAMERDWRSVAPACELAYQALRERGLEREADAWSERLRQQQELLAQAHDEAMTLRKSDDLAPPELPSAMIDEIVQRCRERKWVHTVWIVQKRLRTLPHTVLVIAVRPRLFRAPNQKQLDDLFASLPMQEEVMLHVVNDGGYYRKLERVVAGRRR